MDALKQNVRRIFILVCAVLLLKSYLIFSTALEVTEHAFQLLTVERHNIVSEMALQIADKDTDRSGRIAAGRVLRNADAWRPIALHYRSVEIYPIDVVTHKSLYPSVLSGKISQNDRESINLRNDIAERRFVYDHRGARVLRVTGLATMGIYTYVVNADVDLSEVVGSHSIHFFIHILVLLIVLRLAQQASKLRSSADEDKLAETAESQLMARILAASLERLSVEAVVAEMVSSTENRIVYVTRGFVGRLGYESREELIGQPLEILLPEDKREQHKHDVAAFHNAPGEHEPGPREVYPINKAGEEVQVYLELGITEHVRGNQYLVASVH